MFVDNGNFEAMISENSEDEISNDNYRDQHKKVKI